MTLFSDRVKMMRAQKKFTQGQLGLEIGVSQQTIAKWEGGKVEPNLDLLVKLAAALDVSTDYLLGRTDTPYVYGMDLGDGAAAEIRTTRKPSPAEQERLEKMAIDMKATGAGTPVPPGADLEDMVRRLVNQILSERVQDPSGRS